jgi:mannose-6-phosphate isomerase-like protein (cupin superfamily)
MTENATFGRYAEFSLEEMAERRNGYDSVTHDRGSCPVRTRFGWRTLRGEPVGTDRSALRKSIAPERWRARVLRLLPLLALFGATQIHAQTVGKSAIVISPQQVESVLQQKLAGTADEYGDGLFDGNNFRIGALKRKLPGEVEIHQKDTDIMYVLSGRATLITGGDVVNEHSISTIEVRGTAIRNGTRHALMPGDVVVIPKQQAHWFQNVVGNVSYIVIKVQ